MRTNARSRQCDVQRSDQERHEHRAEPDGPARKPTTTAKITAASAVTPTSFGKNTKRFMHRVSGSASNKS
jgi:hypothetical protein